MDFSDAFFGGNYSIRFRRADINDERILLGFKDFYIHSHVVRRRVETRRAIFIEASTSFYVLSLLVTYEALLYLVLPTTSAAAGFKNLSHCKNGSDPPFLGWVT